MQCGDTELKALATQLGAALLARGESVVTAESCTGGWIAKVITDVDGSSGWFAQGLVTYSNQSKQRLLGVDPNLIERFGAVSEEVVVQMASGAHRLNGGGWSIAVSGIAGPTGGTVTKPAGTVCIAIDGRCPWVTTRWLPGSRDDVRRGTVAIALSQLIEHVTG